MSSHGIPPLSGWCLVDPTGAALSSVVNPLLEDHQSARVRTLEAQSGPFLLSLGMGQVCRHGHEFDLMS